MLKVLESPGKISLKVGHHFSGGLSGTQSAMESWKVLDFLPVKEWEP